MRNGATATRARLAPSGRDGVALTLADSTGQPVLSIRSLVFRPISTDELAAAWDGAKVNLPLLSSVNGAPFGRPNAGVDNTFDFPALIVHAAKTRPTATWIFLSM